MKTVWCAQLMTFAAVLLSIPFLYGATTQFLLDTLSWPLQLLLLNITTASTLSNHFTVTSSPGNVRPLPTSSELTCADNTLQPCHKQSSSHWPRENGSQIRTDYHSNMHSNLAQQLAKQSGQQPHETRGNWHHIIPAHAAQELDWSLSLSRKNPWREKRGVSRKPLPPHLLSAYLNLYSLSTLTRMQENGVRSLDSQMKSSVVLQNTLGQVRQEGRSASS